MVSDKRCSTTETKQAFFLSTRGRETEDTGQKGWLHSRIHRIRGREWIPATRVQRGFQLWVSEFTSVHYRTENHAACRIFRKRNNFWDRRHDAKTDHDLRVVLIFFSLGVLFTILPRAPLVTHSVSPTTVSHTMGPFQLGIHGMMGGICS